MRSGSVMTVVSLMLLLATSSLTVTGAVSDPLPEENDFGDLPVNSSGLRAAGVYSFPDDVPAARVISLCTLTVFDARTLMQKTILKCHGLRFKHRIFKYGYVIQSSLVDRNYPGEAIT